MHAARRNELAKLDEAAIQKMREVEEARLRHIAKAITRGFF